MTVMVNESSKRFYGSGSAGPFTWTWRFLANTDVRVYRILEPNEADISLEVLDLLVEGVDYTLAGAVSYVGGSLVLNEVLAAGTDLLVKRMTEPLQRVAIRNQGNNFRPAVHEDVFDRQVMMIQDRDREVSTNAEEIGGLKPRMAAAEADIDALEGRTTAAEDKAGRSIKVPAGQLGETMDGTEYGNRAGMVLGWNSLGVLALKVMNYVTSSALFTNPWADVRGYASINAVVAALAGTSIQLRIFGNHALTANLTTPANIELKVMNGGLIDTTGYTLTINGPFEAGTYRVFVGTGAVTGLKEALPEWWGAIGDNATDNAAAFKAAQASAVPVYLHPGNYKSSFVVNENLFYGPGVIVHTNMPSQLRTANTSDIITTPSILSPSSIPRTLAKLKARQPVRIVFSGDSVTQGGQNGLTDNDSYTAAFARLIAAAYPDAYVSRRDKPYLNNYQAGNSTPIGIQGGSWPIEVVRNGIGGNNVPRLMARSMGIFGNADGSGVDCVFIMLGINDSLADPIKHQTPAEFEQSYDALIREILRNRPDVDVVLMTPSWNQTTVVGDGDDPSSKLDTYADATKRVAARHQLGCVDIRKLFVDHYTPGNGLFGFGTWFDRPLGNPSPNYADGAHPGITGHAAIAQCIFNTLFAVTAPQGLGIHHRDLISYINAQDATGFYTHGGSGGSHWSQRGENGFEGTTFPQVTTSTAGDWVTFQTKAHEVWALFQPVYAGAGGATAVTASVNGTEQTTFNMQSTMGNDGNTFFPTAPRQRFLVYRNGGPTTTPYTVTLTNVSGGLILFDGVELVGEEPPAPLVYTAGTWTPVDTSGAALALDVRFAKWLKIGNMVTVQALIFWPATANTAGVTIGALPFTAAANGFASMLILSNSTVTGIAGQVNAGTNAISVYGGGATSTPVTNSNLSGKYINFSFSYLL